MDDTLYALDQILETCQPIFVCVVLPVCIALIVSKTVRLREAKRTEILLKALESGKDVDANTIANAMSKAQKTPQQQRTTLLARGSIGTIMGILLFAFSANNVWLAKEPAFCFGALSVILFSFGIGNLITYFVTGKQNKN